MSLAWQLLMMAVTATVLFSQADMPLGAGDAKRASRVAALRAEAKEHIEQERALYTDEQLQDIEARYRSADEQTFPFFLRRDAGQILRDLVAAYPKSNRAGCAVLDLARLAAGEIRERYLMEAIANHSDAWCASGVQVGALARARLAVHYAGFERFAEAERLASELTSMFPGAIDETGAPLEDVLEGVRLLKH